jgi:ferrochelatase
MKKTAVILFNLGGPDNLKAVRPFLFNLFNDPAIIRLPQPLRFFIARLISGKRDKVAQDIYAKLGGGSPILPNTQAQADALEKVLNSPPLEGGARGGGDQQETPSPAKTNDLAKAKPKFSLPLPQGKRNYRCFIAMRYWKPFVEETIHEVKKFAPDEIILLPLYPQFSTTTTASSLESWTKTAKKSGLDIPTKSICCYPEQSGFIGALAKSILAAYEKTKVSGAPRILFSAHSLPEKIVKAGDPYAWQCEQTVKALVQKLNIPNLDYVLCYQSRVGPLQWIGPATDAEILRAGKTKTPLVVVPIAFVSEHSETLVEIDMEYRHLAAQNGVPFYAYVPTVSTDAEFISGLAGLVVKAQNYDGVCTSDTGGRICPKEFSGCCRSLTPDP